MPFVTSTDAALDYRSTHSRGHDRGDYWSCASRNVVQVPPACSKRTHGFLVSQGGTACRGCAAEQQEAKVCTLNFDNVLASRREYSLRLLVPAAHSHPVEVPSGEGDQVTGLLNLYLLCHPAAIGSRNGVPVFAAANLSHPAKHSVMIPLGNALNRRQIRLNSMRSRPEYCHRSKRTLTSVDSSPLPGRVELRHPHSAGRPTQKQKKRHYESCCACVE